MIHFAAGLVDGNDFFRRGSCLPCLLGLLSFTIDVRIASLYQAFGKWCSVVVHIAKQYLSSVHKLHVCCTCVA